MPIVTALNELFKHSNAAKRWNDNFKALKKAEDSLLDMDTRELNILKAKYRTETGGK